MSPVGSFNVAEGDLLVIAFGFDVETYIWSCGDENNDWRAEAMVESVLQELMRNNAWTVCFKNQCIVVIKIT